MVGFVISFLVGIICVLLGRENMRGNISSIHAYHRSRVSEADRVPFGKQVGMGTILIGIGIMAFSLLSALSLYAETAVFLSVGTALLSGCLVVGLLISFHAMLKYNHGIF